MNDDLIKRLERANEYEPLGHDGWEAAAALSEAQATIARLDAALTRIVGMDSHIDASIRSGTTDRVVVYGDLARIALAALSPREGDG